MPAHERDLVPAHERDAAHAALVQLVGEKGSQTAAAAAIGFSQAAINKAILYKQIGPSLVRAVLGHFGVDTNGLLRRFGDPSMISAAGSAAPASGPALSPKEEAIAMGVRFGGGVAERDVRRIADELEAYLGQNAAPIEWVSMLLNKVRSDLLVPRLEKKAETRTKESTQRRVRKLQDARRTPSTPPGSPTPPGTKISR